MNKRLFAITFDVVVQSADDPDWETSAPKAPRKLTVFAQGMHKGEALSRVAAALDILTYDFVEAKGAPWKTEPAS